MKKLNNILDDLEDVISPLQREIIDLLQKKGPMSRDELVKKLGKPRTTIYDNIIRLGNYDLIRKIPRPRNNVGRPVIYFKLKV